ncbi:daunorubicin resistance protein DrrA family ABC transporter ATP-binding protein [soil metagenome]
MDDVMIEVEGVRRRFGDVTALDGVDLSVARGKVLGLLGPNGAGKTTLVRVLTTLLRPDEGRATVAGLDVVRDTMALRSVIGLAGQSAAVEPDMTGRENLVMVGRLYHLPTAEARRRADEVLERIDLTDAADRPAKTYSGGMRRRLDLAASLVGRPMVLFMDEPTTGLDPRSRMDLWGLITELVADGTTLLLTTQYLEEADRLTDSIAVIDRGRVIAEGTSDELKTRVGGDVLQLTLLDRTRTAEAAAALVALGPEAPRTDELTGEIQIATGLGAQALVQAVRALDDLAIEVDDLALRRPTLDEVFLTLTGAPAEDAPSDTPPRRGRRGRTRTPAGRTA